MSNEEKINKEIKQKNLDTNLISDGYHTFGELYEHRIALYIALCSYIVDGYETHTNKPVWRSKLHHDGTTYDGWFIMGIKEKPGEQISYHLPLKYWDQTNFVKTLEKAPEWDGHTPADVVKRLLNL